MEPIKIDNKNIYFPPGGILIWIIILLELITFGIALIVLAVSSKENPELFQTSSSHLNTTYGAINTIFLLTSGYFMANALHYFKHNDVNKTSIYLKLAIIGGMLFLGLKTIEYLDKIAQGYVLGYDTFFNFYWLLTGFHVIHVIVGLIILISTYFGLKNKQKLPVLEDVEAGAAFWHMCDLIWLLLFPVLYLIF